ncbi:simple sugar transport system ATP-binding protein [Mycoplasmopsis mustelae]|uniref:Simple sugar transport system ATP-binding protein n=1 Tax=Mycoplasmopsis mustelae TaxID=171289 RepID=A0A4V3FNY1_9BACT|nr:ATP-binding cassette domain-containing protein [Mycoplasmopsis mustelae]TDV24320.1 simple sugar transport system ATP-binding protein [Mycoplasmopsis mustelae]
MQEINAIEFVGICKSFGQIKANQNISFKVKKGTIHALIGENGAGKSTLMSILFGLYEPDKGYIKVNNKEVLIKQPNDANKLRIGMVHQHFKLVDVYTNLENIVLGAEDNNKITKIIDYKPAIRKIKAIQETFNLYFDLNKITGKETVATQQKVEIMKMLYRDSDILIFDEPTAVLTDQEIQGLLETFKLFRSQGKTILFISHKLGEIKEVSDHATVLRLGKVTGDFDVKDVSIEEMATRMVGEEVEIARNEYTNTSNNPIVLSLKNITTTGEKPLKDISLDVRSGEIVAIAGVEGNGQLDLEYVVSGMKKPETGDVLLSKTELTNQRLKDIKKSNFINSYTYLSISILLFILSLVFYLITPTTSDQIYTFKILGTLFILSFAIFLVIFIKKQFGWLISKYINQIEKNPWHRLHRSQKNFARSSIILSAISFLGFLIYILLLSSLKSGPMQLTNWIGSISFYIIGFLIILLMSASWIITQYYVVFASELGVKTCNKLQKLSYITTGTVITNVLFTFITFITIFGFYKSQTFDFVSVIYTYIAMGEITFITFTIMIVNIALVFKEDYQKMQTQTIDDSFLSLNNFSVRDISRLGLTFIPSDRHKHGLVLDYNIKSNTVLRRLWDAEFIKFGILRDAKIKKENQIIIDKFDVRGARKGLSQARQLSGGNQQKFIVGREMNTPHDFILIVQPTRGLDVGAIKNIHEQILLEKKNGKAILLISYELDEVLALADKIAVINSGEILAIKDVKNLSRTEIGIYMAHKKGAEVHAKA